MQPSLTLYHYWRSSCSWRVRWALALKGLSYKSVPINILQNEHRSAAYKRINPAGLLPTLVINGQPYSEALAIVEGLEELAPTPALLPQDPLSRIYVRQLALSIAAGTQPLQNPAVLNHYTSDPQERTRHAKFFIEKGLEIYETLLHRGRPGTFSFGAQVTLADLCLIPQVYNGLRFGVNVQAYPTVAAIYQNCLATPACQQAAPHNQPGAQP